MSGPTIVVGSVDAPTFMVMTASTSCRSKRSESATEPTRIARDAAEHFCPAWPKALLARSATARSTSADGVITIAFLPLVSARIGRSLRHDRNSAAVSHAPVSTRRSTLGWLMSAWPTSFSGTSTKRSTSRGTPASHSACTMTAAQCRTWGAGLMMTELPAASATSVLPAGIATGKFHGGATTVRRAGSKRASSMRARSCALSA